MEHSTQKQCDTTLPIVLLAGGYQNGKSTLVNCLLGGEYAVEGDGCHTTAYRTTYSYSDGEEKYYKIMPDGKRKLLKDKLHQAVEHKGEDICFEAEVPSPILKKLSLVDAPGWGAEEMDDRQAELSLQNVDYVIYLVRAMQFSQNDKKFLQLLRKSRRYFSVILNVRDLTAPENDSLQAIGNAIVSTLRQMGMDDQYIQYPSKNGVCPINLLWTKFGKHLLDTPPNAIAKQQMEEMDQFFAGQFNHNEVLQKSGFPGWEKFFLSSLKITTKFKEPDNYFIGDLIHSSICKNLINITKEN